MNLYYPSHSESNIYTVFFTPKEASSILYRTWGEIQALNSNDRSFVARVQDTYFI